MDFSQKKETEGVKFHARGPVEQNQERTKKTGYDGENDNLLCLGCNSNKLNEPASYCVVDPYCTHCLINSAVDPSTHSTNDSS